MAITYIVSVRDRAIDAYMQPFFVVAPGLAVRSFIDECNRPESPMCAHPEDYDLYLLGSFNDANGMFIPEERPRQLAIGKDAKTRKE